MSSATGDVSVVVISTCVVLEADGGVRTAINKRYTSDKCEVDVAISWGSVIWRGGVG